MKRSICTICLKMKKIYCTLDKKGKKWNYCRQHIPESEINKKRGGGEKMPRQQSHSKQTKIKVKPVKCEVCGRRVQIFGIEKQPHSPCSSCTFRALGVR